MFFQLIQRNINIIKIENNKDKDRKKFSLYGWMVVVVVLISKNFYYFYYDPSAGSPTETLLRLLLPLDDKAERTFEN